MLIERPSLDLPSRSLCTRRVLENVVRDYWDTTLLLPRRWLLMLPLKPWIRSPGEASFPLWWQNTELKWNLFQERKQVAPPSWEFLDISVGHGMELTLGVSSKTISPSSIGLGSYLGTRWSCNRKIWCLWALLGRSRKMRHWTPSKKSDQRASMGEFLFARRPSSANSWQTIDNILHTI